MSLFGRLYRYRERRDRGHLEDFLTEALCHLLNQLSPPLVKVICLRLFVPSTSRDRFDEEFSKAKFIRWCTQRAISGVGIFDLHLELNGIPVIVIENKINSPLGSDQLGRYGRWLSTRRAHLGLDSSGIVCLLTHHTPAPDDFVDHDMQPYGAVPHSTSWVKLFHVFRQIQRSSLQRTPKEEVLLSQLTEFLSEQKMGDEMLSANDIAAGRVFFGSTKNLIGALNTVSNDIHEINTKYLTSSSSGNMQVHTEDNLIWGWRYFHRLIGLNKSFVAWGLRYPLGSTRWTNVSPSIVDADSIFVCLSTDDRPIPVTPLMGTLGPAGWSSSDSECVIAKPVSDFPQDPEMMNEQMYAWIVERAAEGITAMVQAVRVDAA